MKFRDHKYTWEHQLISTRHQWQFRGPDGGIHFHVSLMDNQDKFPDPFCGLEFHHNKQPYGEPEAAHSSPCWLTGQPCWHDGMALYARETVWPAVKGFLRRGDHDAIFRYLESEYDDHFSVAE